MSARAPFSGQLLTPKLATNLGLKADYCDARVKLEVEHAKSLAQVDLDLERQLRSIDALAAKATSDALRRQVEAVTPPIYERPAFVAVAVAVLTVSMYALAMKSVDWVK